MANDCPLNPASPTPILSPRPSVNTHITCQTRVSTCAALSGLVVSDSLQQRGLQPARLLCPWDSPGKNTGVDCHALLQGIFPTQGLNPGLPHCGRFFTVCCCRRQVASVVSDSVRPHRWQPTRLLCPWDSPGKNIGVGCHFCVQRMHAC